MPLPPEYAIDSGTATSSRRHDTVQVPVFWIVLLLSVLVHLVVLFLLPPLHLTLRPASDPESPLSVELLVRRPALEAPVTVPKPAFVPPASAPRTPPQREAAPTPRVAPPPQRPAPQPRAPEAVAKPAPSTPPAPRTITPVKPAPNPESTIAQAGPQAPAPRADSSGAPDLASYIEARRRARGETASPPPPAPATSEPAPLDEEARRNAIVARNLGLGRTPSFGGSRMPGGGIFQITSLHYDYAEFLFYGWNKEIRRNTTQRIEVRKGDHPTIELAVVRRMIAIIREHESGDFLWESDRLGRDVVLSARPQDNAGLEEFLMREFFGATRRGGGSLG